MKVKISATFEGKCDLCNSHSLVFSAGDEESKKVVTICRKCSDGLGEMKVEDVVEKYGKVDEKPFEQGVRIEGKSIGG